MVFCSGLSSVLTRALTSGNSNRSARAEAKSGTRSGRLNEGMKAPFELFHTNSLRFSNYHAQTQHLPDPLLAHRANRPAMQSRPYRSRRLR